MARKLLLASAGAGKSRRIAEKALEHAAAGRKVLLLTYTINNQGELVKEICRLNSCQPENVVVKGWFNFLLEDMIRPYQQCIVPDRISGVLLNPGNPHLVPGKNYAMKGRSERLDGKFNPLHFVTPGDNRAHTYYLAKLAARVHSETKGRAAHRLAEIYSAIFVDEVQDLVGWDYDIIKALTETNILEIECVGDFRQAVYQTSETNKLPQDSTEKLAQFNNMGFISESLAISWRCLQAICGIADRLHSQEGHYLPTMSNVEDVPLQYAGHQGVFAVPKARLREYIETYRPAILRWNRSTQKELCDGQTAYNFGECKGLGFERVLILPPAKHAKFLSGDMQAFDGSETDDSRNKLYVAITRARYSVAFPYEGGNIIEGAQAWPLENLDP
ncbi:UvrD-helicase domain-containing protein [Lysobacter antibioticus]|uniref:UvrD-helicase domain-containing protein n=1 Tax=Lysobacter antibioticus TaxID=84531 RepID=UPI000716EAB8|nr:UvrD-helicase domain-containing protein [Lysobacter antibioticus]